MPSTMGLLFGAYAEALGDDIPWLQVAYAHADRSALGSASGFGVPLPLDRAFVAELLGMEAVQPNTLAVQNDRGKTESLVLGAAMQPALDLGRLASDLIWFSSDELGFVHLAAEVTTGSSIMPQKRNPDVLELARATAAKLRSRHAEIGSVYGCLSAGYHRDLQLTKEPFLEGMQAAIDLPRAVAPVLRSLEVDEARCRAAMTRSIGATDIMCRVVARGEPLRNAYKAASIGLSTVFFGLAPYDAGRAIVKLSQ
jgi:argininosuccinate lyase